MAAGTSEHSDITTRQFFLLYLAEFPDGPARGIWANRARQLSGPCHRYKPQPRNYHKRYPDTAGFARVDSGAVSDPASRKYAVFHLPSARRCLRSEEHTSESSHLGIS